MCTTMPAMRYLLLHLNTQLTFVEMPASHAYQLTALHHRLHKEIGKLTANNVPTLPNAVAEFDNLDLSTPNHTITHGLAYINQLEQAFAAVQETTYPLIALLTEIRALQAQLEQWYEEEYMD
jgi:hypothetical protein